MKFMFKRLLGLVILFSVLVSLAGCAGKAQTAAETEIPTVTVWGHGSQEVREAMQAVADKYNADPDYSKIAHVEIQFVVSGTSEQSLPDRLAAAYQAGEKDTEFDLVAFDDNTIASILAKTSDDFFEPIDTSKIPNYDNLIFKENVVGNTFIPYRGTSVLLAYNSETVPNPPKTAEELYQWIHEHPGRFTYCIPGSGGSGSSFAFNAVYNNLPEEAATSADTKWHDEHTAEWDAGFALLAELHPDLYQTSGKVQYPNKNAGSLDLLSTNQIDMTTSFVDLLLTRKEMGTMPDSIKLTQISPSFMGALAGFSIPTIAKDKEEALSVIDYFLSYEAQAETWNKQFASPVVDTTKLQNIKHEDWLKELDLNSLRFFSIGSNSTTLVARWTDEIAPLAQ